MSTANWTVDASHSEIGFSVKHMMISNVRGTFKKFDAKLVADHEDLTTAEIDFTIDVASIDTRDEGRDNHLRGGDFFDVETYPTMTFKSTGVKKKAGNEYDLMGDLTLHGVTHPVTFHVTYEGGGKDPWGGERAGYTATGTIDRTAFGLSFNAALETGGVLVGEKVKLNLEIELVKQA